MNKVTIAIPKVIDKRVPSNIYQNGDGDYYILAKVFTGDESVAFSLIGLDDGWCTKCARSTVAFLG